MPVCIFKPTHPEATGKSVCRDNLGPVSLKLQVDAASQPSHSIIPTARQEVVTITIPCDKWGAIQTMDDVALRQMHSPRIIIVRFESREILSGKEVSRSCSANHGVCVGISQQHIESNASASYRRQLGPPKFSVGQSSSEIMNCTTFGEADAHASSDQRQCISV